MPNTIVKEKIESAPTVPGCYIFKDKEGTILYVGKAINIRNRVNQYFKGQNDIFKMSITHSPKIQRMISLIHDVEFHTVDSEVEALILEANLIKKYRPKYNTLLKDDKQYAWIKITKREAYPQLFRTREKKNDGSLYFGPYPDGRTVIMIIKYIRKVFPFRTCHLPIPKEGHFPNSRLCLFYHMGLCPGPCDYLISYKEYRQNINSIIRFLRGEKLDLIKDLEKKMTEYAKQEEYEKAAYIRDRIQAAKYITQRIGVEHGMDERELEEKKRQNAAEGIVSLFEKLQIPLDGSNRIECYDISNIQGTNPVGAMVVFENGMPKKSDYRKFKIKNMHGPNDFAMMKQMLSRRLLYLKEGMKETGDTSFSSIPQLIIVDGGKGQLRYALEALEESKLPIPLVSLAKREEELFLPGKKDSIRLPRTSQALFLIQRIRDEAHRFGITFHRKLRNQVTLESDLDKIAGVGEKRRTALLQAFGSIEGIRSAQIDEVEKIVKNRKLAETILSQLAIS